MLKVRGLVMKGCPQGGVAIRVFISFLHLPWLVNRDSRYTACPINNYGEFMGFLAG